MSYAPKQTTTPAYAGNQNESSTPTIYKQQMDYKFAITLHYNRILGLTAIIPSSDANALYKEHTVCFAVMALEAALKPYLDRDEKYKADFDTWLNDKERHPDEVNPMKAMYRLAQFGFITTFLHTRGMLLEEVIHEEVNANWNLPQ